MWLSAFACTAYDSVTSHAKQETANGRQRSWLPCSPHANVIDSMEVRPKWGVDVDPAPGARDQCHVAHQMTRAFHFQEDGTAVIQPSDTPTSQSAATRWTFRRRLGLLLRTRFDAEGATLSLHDVAARTHGRVSADHLMTLLSQDETQAIDPVMYVLLAQAFDVDPDFFVTDEAVRAYVATIRTAALEFGSHESETSLQRLAFLSATGLIATTPANIF